MRLRVWPSASAQKSQLMTQSSSLVVQLKTRRNFRCDGGGHWGHFVERQSFVFLQRWIEEAAIVVVAVLNTTPIIGKDDHCLQSGSPVLFVFGRIRSLHSYDEMHSNGAAATGNQTTVRALIGRAQSNQVQSPLAESIVHGQLSGQGTKTRLIEVFNCIQVMMNELLMVFSFGCEKRLFARSGLLVHPKNPCWPNLAIEKFF